MQLAGRPDARWRLAAPHAGTRLNPFQLEACLHRGETRLGCLQTLLERLGADRPRRARSERDIVLFLRSVGAVLEDKSRYQKALRLRDGFQRDAVGPFELPLGNALLLSSAVMPGFGSAIRLPL